MSTEHIATLKRVRGGAGYRQRRGFLKLRKDADRKRLFWGVSKTQTADLENTDLENADLENADLENADLENVVYLLVEKLHPFILDGRNKI